MLLCVCCIWSFLYWCVCVCVAGFRMQKERWETIQTLMHSYEIQTTFLSLLHALPSPLLTFLISSFLFSHSSLWYLHLKKKTLCLSALCSLLSLLASSFLLAHSPFSSSSHPISFTSLFQFCLSSLPPSSCLTHNHSHLILLLLLLLYYSASISAAFFLPEPLLFCCLMAAVLTLFFPLWTFFELCWWNCQHCLFFFFFFFNSCWFTVKIIKKILLLEFFMIWWKVFTLLCIRALGLQQGVCELFSMAAVKTKHFWACDWFKSCCVSAQTGRLQEDFRFSHCMQMLLTNVRCRV